MSTDRKELQDRIVAFLESHAESKFEKCDENSQLLGNLGFNSLDLMMIVNDAEDEFGIIIEDGDMNNIVTVGDVVDLVARKSEG